MKIISYIICYTLYISISIAGSIFINYIYNLNRQQSEEGEKNGSEDEDEEKPGKRVMGPRKKFVWDDKLR